MKNFNFRAYYYVPEYVSMAIYDKKAKSQEEFIKKLPKYVLKTLQSVSNLDIEE